MKISIRYQILGLVTGILLAAMSLYLYLATSLFAQDKLAYVFDQNARLADTLAEEVRANLAGTAEKLLFFGQLQQEFGGAPDPDRRARSLFATDENVLALELWTGGPAFVRSYQYRDAARLASLNLAEEDLETASREHRLVPAAAAAEKMSLENVSLPPELGLLRVAAASADGSFLAVGYLRPDRFLHLFAKSPLYEAYLVDPRGEVLIHPDPAKILSHTSMAGVPVVKDALDGAVRSGAREFEAHGAVLGAFARVGRGRLAVVVQSPKAEALKATRELTRRSVLFAVIVILVAFTASIFFSRWLAAPLRRLEETMVLVSQGEFGVQVPVKSRNEIGTLAVAFNRMSQELGDRESKLMDANAQLIQSEKLSALGEMSAGLVHEVKNPMVGIVGFAQLGHGSETLTEALEYFQLIESDAKRANDILMSMLEFARQEKVELEPLEPKGVVQGAVKLVAHHLNIQGVTIQQEFEEALPKIRGNTNQLRQVLMNLMMNAGHAMEASPKKVLTVSVRATGSVVSIAVQDTGTGMSEQTRQKLFRPFFTTKVKGKGTGLGLSVSNGIVAQHKGKIRVESELGKGTTFFVDLPREGVTGE